jgi:cbb3-type cytochrome oxidase maturation protein
VEILIVLIPLALILGGFFVFAFIWSARKGQYDDVETPKFRILLDDNKISKPTLEKIKDKE